MSDDNQRMFVYPAGKKKIACRTDNQRIFIDNTRNSVVSIALGSAGAGKSFLSLAVALEMLNNNTIEKIVLSRPVVYAGEDLGALPGTLEEKVAEFTAVPYGILDELVGKQKRIQYLKDEVICFMAVGTLRGRTLSNTAIILDEAQNMTKTQMQLFLTRIGKNSRVIINGDQSQVDLRPKTRSGLMDAVSRIGKIDGVSVVEFTPDDVQRSKIVKDIIRSYET